MKCYGTKKHCNQKWILKESAAEDFTLEILSNRPIPSPVYHAFHHNRESNTTKKGVVLDTLFDILFYIVVSKTMPNLRVSKQHPFSGSGKHMKFKNLGHRNKRESKISINPINPSTNITPTDLLVTT